ncbi:hypothetical protein HK105_201627 [Polyrhizophydium stewartii]|uniref:Uncharacterized protein n=1 Tax=Polyrhizophydium stewartii TaxID=2732419 RepID=A0ABR4NGY1_9FUNG
MPRRSDDIEKTAKDLNSKFGFQLPDRPPPGNRPPRGNKARGGIVNIHPALPKPLAGAEQSHGEPLGVSSGCNAADLHAADSGADIDARR